MPSKASHPNVSPAPSGAGIVPAPSKRHSVGGGGVYGAGPLPITTAESN